MNLMMLLIVVVIVVPGYFIVNRIARAVYSEGRKMDDATEKNYGFEQLEKKINKKNEAAQNDQLKEESEALQENEIKEIQEDKKDEKEEIILNR